MANYKWYLGTDLKFLVEMTASGFSMDDNDWSVTVYIGNKAVKEYDKSECVRDDDGNWYVCIQSDLLKKGDISLVGHARVPDTDFDDNYRDEVDKQLVGRMLKV